MGFATIMGVFETRHLSFAGRRASSIRMRGIVYSVQAEDMLLSAGALDDAEAKQIDARS
jgi:hypothetical protein